jgi:plasmid stability protein
VVNFHLRNIPDPLYERLQKRAEAAGRSMNKELLQIVEKELSRPSPEELVARLDEIRRTIKLSPDAPRPEDLIREDRDTDHGRSY